MGIGTTEMGRLPHHIMPGVAAVYGAFHHDVN